MSQTATILPTEPTPVSLLTAEEAAFVNLVSSNIVFQIINDEKSNNLQAIQQ